MKIETYKEWKHCHCGINNELPWLTSKDTETRGKTRYQSETMPPAWLATPKMNARDAENIYIQLGH